MFRLQELVGEVIQDGDVSARELSFLTPNERTYELSATRLQGSHGAVTGVIIVFHDITRMRQFENTRKEFVANVSHELRTPLRSSRGMWRPCSTISRPTTRRPASFCIRSSATRTAGGADCRFVEHLGAGIAAGPPQL